MPGADAGFVAVRVSQDPPRPSEAVGYERAAGGERGRDPRFSDVMRNGDVDVELDETFFVKLTSTPNTHAVIVDGSGLGTILNDD